MIVNIDRCIRFKGGRNNQELNSDRKCNELQCRCRFLVQQNQSINEHTGKHSEIYERGYTL